MAAGLGVEPRLEDPESPVLPLHHPAIQTCKFYHKTYFRILYNLSMSNLANQKCVPCESWVPPMTPEKVQEMLKQVKAWTGEDSLKIKKSFKFKDFKEAMNYVNKVASLAEKEGHHPDITITYNKITIILATHLINGLHENDFRMAAKIDLL